MALPVVDPSKCPLAKAAVEGTEGTVGQSVSLQVKGATKATVTVGIVAEETFSRTVGTVFILAIFPDAGIVLSIGFGRGIGTRLQAALPTVVRDLVVVVLLVAGDVVDVRVIVAFVVAVMAYVWRSR